MQRFTIPRDLYFGEDAVNYLKEVKGKKAIIVFGSERLIKDGTIEKVTDALKIAGIESVLFPGVEPDPSVETVMRGAKAMIDETPDLIVGVGGGSPIDAAKAMWIFYEYPEFTFEEAAKPFNLPELRKKAKFIAIPTTSGTATEVTSFSVITDYKTGIKYPIADYNITPDVAILDTSLVQSMPKGLTANTGMDALAHAFEAYVSVVRNPITDALALKAIQMIGEDLVDSYNGCEKARNNMHLAQCLAGMSFSNAILGIVHSIAHKTGKTLGIDHGLANAIYLTYVIEFNAKEALKDYADIGRALKIKGESDKEIVEELVKFIVYLRTSMNMPHTLKEYGVSEEEFKEKLEGIAVTAVADPCTGTNPRKIDVEEMKKLIEAIYYGRKVDF